MASKGQPAAPVASGATTGTGRINPASAILGLASIALAGGVLSGASVPFVADDRTALLALAVIGLACCGTGPLGQIAATGRWLSPGGIFGSVIGVVALALVVGVVAGVSLPFIASDRDAFIALAGMMLAKFAAGVLYRLRAGA